MSIPVAVSFEFFPPSDEPMGRQLWESVQRLAPLQPNFVSVTYGADGSTRTRTHECVLRILRETHLTVAPHLTCVGASRAEVLRIAQDYWQQGVRHLVALRGDAPATHQSPEGRYRPHPGGFAYASDLVAGLGTVGRFEMSVAAYPEGHPESGSIEADLQNLKRKVDAGASRAITQFFFDTDIFLRYRDRCAAAGIHADHRSRDPADHALSAAVAFCRALRCIRAATGCAERFDGLDDDPETRRMIAANVAIEQVQRLREHGVDEFHFYTLNRAELTYAICHALGLRPRCHEAQVA